MVVYAQMSPQCFSRLEENDANTLNIIVAFLSSIETFLSSIGPISGNLRKEFRQEILA